MLSCLFQTNPRTARGRTDPLTIGFAELPLSVVSQRAGLVFNPVRHRGIYGRARYRQYGPCGARHSWAIQRFSHPQTTFDGFGFQWANRVNSMVVGDQLGHVSVVTTENFNVGTNPNQSLNSFTR